MTYRPDIDGLRGLAVLGVLLYHLDFSLPGGYVGVDIFFVISGFLMSTIVGHRIDTGLFRYRDFWSRRIRRLLPAYLTVYGATAFFSIFLLLPNDLENFGWTTLWQAALAPNIYFSMTVEGGYFAAGLESRPLLHTWSLGVEEQFYLLLPVTLLGMRQLSATSTRWIFGAAIISSLGASWLLTIDYPSFSFYNLPTRVWEFALGALVARVTTIKKPVAEALALMGMGSILYAFLSFTEETPFPSYRALVPCVGGALVILSNNQTQTWIGRILSRKPLRALGLISYSLYLWHWPLISFGIYLGLAQTAGQRALIGGVSLALSMLSWHFVEQPVRTRRYLASHKQLMSLATFAWLGSLVIGGILVHTEGLKRCWSEQALTYIKSAEERLFYRNTTDLDDPSQLVVLGDRSAAQASFLLWGDSHAMSYATALDALGRDYGVKGVQLTLDSKPPLATEDWHKFALECARYHAVDTVVLAGFWSSYQRPDLTRDFQITIDSLNEEGFRVVLLADYPAQKCKNPPRLLALSTRHDLPMEPPRSARIHRVANRKPAEAFSLLKNVIVVDPASRILELDSYQKQGQVLYRDAHHLTRAGALLLRPDLVPIFESVKQTGR